MRRQYEEPVYKRRLYQVSAGHMCAGFAIDKETDRVVMAAPILARLFDRSIDEVMDIAREKSWVVQLVGDY